MRKYLFQASYTIEGVNGLLEVGGLNRAKVVESLVSSLGGSLESFYYAFGEDDAYVIAELPGDEAAAALSLRVSAAGAATVKTTVLLDPATMDDAVKKSVSYTPPGS